MKAIYACHTTPKHTFVDTQTKMASVSDPSRLRRRAEIMKKYPNHIPVVVEAGSGAPALNRNKFLVPPDFTCADLCHVVRKQVGVGLKREQALFVFGRTASGAVALSGNTLVRTAYAAHQDTDGNLPVVYCLENAFG